MIRMFRWIQTHRYCLAGLYAIVFLFGFFLLEVISPQPVIWVHCFVDDWIPFNEWFVIPYFLWYVWVPVFLIYFMVTDRDTYLKLIFTMFGGATFCLFVYALLPNGLDLRRPVLGRNVCAKIVELLRWIDPPCNVCPSIHVSSTVAILFAILQSERFRHSRRMKVAAWAVTLAISVSTLFIKQHSVVDVVCGYLLTVGMDQIYQRWMAKKRKKRPGSVPECQ